MKNGACKLRLWIAVAASLLATAIGWGQQSDPNAVVAERVEGLNRQLAEEILQPPDSIRIRALLTERATLLMQLISSRPATAIALALPEGTATQLRAADPDAPIESSGEWQGTTEAIVEDDFEHGRSRTRWFLATQEGKFELFFADQPPRLPGAAIRIRGLRSSDRIAVAANLSLAVRTSPIHTESDGELLPRDLGMPTAQTVQQCTTIGPQNIAVLMLTTPSNPTFPAGFTPSYFQQVFFGTGSGSLTTDSLNRYWQDASYGLTSATGQVFGPFALSQDFTCDQGGQLLTAAVNAADATVDFSQYTRIALVYPQTCASTGGLGCWTIQSPSKGNLPEGVAWLPTQQGAQTTDKLAALVHEFGHTFGLNHANSDDYNNVPLGALGSSGVNSEYADPFSSMGYNYTYNNQKTIGQYSAEHKSLMLHWLPPGGYQEVQSSGTFTLAPYESASGLRALRVLRDKQSGAWLWVEYRQPVGDADGSFTIVGGNTNVFNGALIHYEDPFLDTGHTYLLDFNPVRAPNNFFTFFNAALTPGHPWSDPYSPLTLTVNSATSSALSIAINYDQPCAALQSSSSTLFNASGGTGTITVSAAAGCSWTASAADSWITLTGATSGQGNGTIPFAVAPNNAALQRNSSITVQRQSIAFMEAGAGMSVLSVSPNSGQGASGQFTFQFSDGSGAQDLTQVVLFLADLPRNPGCTINLDPRNGFIGLWNDAGSVVTYFTQLNTSSTSTRSNSQCAVYATGSSFTISGNQLTVTVQVSFAASFAGTYRIRAQAFNSAGSTAEIPLGTWTVPPLTVGAVVNGASFAAGAPVAPGSIVSIFGSSLAASALAASSTPLPTALLTTSVTINGISTPLYYVSPTQINAQVPFEIPPGTATLAVNVNGDSSPAVTFTVAAAAPGIFQYGTNRAVAVNPDGSINASNQPAKPGDVIVVYMTGQGAVSNPVPTGAPALGNPLSMTLATTTATIGTTNAEVLFSGMAPGFVGLLQANIRIPNVAAGDRLLVVTIAGAAGQAAVVTVGAQ